MVWELFLDVIFNLSVLLGSIKSSYPFLMVVDGISNSYQVGLDVGMSFLSYDGISLLVSYFFGEPLINTQTNSFLILNYVYNCLFQFLINLASCF